MNVIKVKIEFGILIGLMVLISCTGDQTTKYNHHNLEFIEKYDDLNLNLKVAFDDFGTVNRYAKEINKPILTIYGCYSCVGDPKGIWRPLASKEINSILRNDFLIRYYHTDNKAPLPDSIISITKLKTVGDFFLDKQITNYKINSQPLYTITDWEENNLTEPIGYVTKDKIEIFREFIIKGKTSDANKAY